MAPCSPECTGDGGVLLTIFSYHENHLFPPPPQKYVLWSECHLMLKPECRGGDHLKTMCVLGQVLLY